MNQKQIPAMQDETRALSVPLRLSGAWPQLSLGLSRQHPIQASVPFLLLFPWRSPVLFALYSSVVCPPSQCSRLPTTSHTQDHSLFLMPLASRMLDSPGSFFFLLSPWVCFLRLSWWPLIFYPCWCTDFWPLRDGILQEGPGCQVFSYLDIPSFSLNTAFLLMISSLFLQSWLIPRMPDLHMPPAAPPLECHTKVKSTGAKHNSGFSCPKPAYTLPALGGISVGDNCLSSCSGQMPLNPRFLSLSLSDSSLAFSKLESKLSVFLCFTCSIQYHHSYLIYHDHLPFALDH